MSEEFLSADMRYPNVPGWKGTDTSEAAAEFIKPHCGRLQKLFLEAVRASGERGATSDEVAASLEIDHCTARPRATELKRMGLIRDSGERRAFGRSNTRSVVWVVVDQQEAAA